MSCLLYTSNDQNGKFILHSFCIRKCLNHIFSDAPSVQHACKLIIFASFIQSIPPRFHIDPFAGFFLKFDSFPQALHNRFSGCRLKFHILSLSVNIFQTISLHKNSPKVIARHFVNSRQILPGQSLYM